MSGRLGVAVVLLLGTPVFAHRLDEYLQATIISLEKDRVGVFMRLVPGVAVSSSVLARIHRGGDGAISEIEQRNYAERVLKDVSVSVDGTRLIPQLVSVRFPQTETIKEGMGEIQLEFTAPLLRSRSAKRVLIWENRHESKISAYLVNALVPQDHDLRIISQKRNEDQSFYELSYSQNATHSQVPAGKHLRGSAGWWGSVVLFILAGVTALFGKQRVRRNSLVVGRMKIL